MSFNQYEHLKKVHQNRRSDTVNNVNKTISHLLEKKETINFSKVSKESGIGKSTLYSIPELKEKIVFYRKKSLQQSYKQNNNTSKKDIQIQSLKRKIINLETENKELKLKLKRLYGDFFESTIQN